MRSNGSCPSSASSGVLQRNSSGHTWAWLVMRTNSIIWPCIVSVRIMTTTSMPRESLPEVVYFCR